MSPGWDGGAGAQCLLLFSRRAAGAFRICFLASFSESPDARSRKWKTAMPYPVPFISLCLSWPVTISGASPFLVVKEGRRLAIMSNLRPEGPERLFCKHGPEAVPWQLQLNQQC